MLVKKLSAPSDPSFLNHGTYQFTGLMNGAMTAPMNQGQADAIFAQGDIKNFRNLGDVEVVAYHYWVTSRLPIKSVDTTSNIVSFQKKSVFRLTDNYVDKGRSLLPGQRGGGASSRRTVVLG